MARPKITLYVDTVSPFAYEAYYILRNNGTFRTCDIRYTPILLGGLMKTCGNTAPMQIKNKDKWIAKERLRWATAFGVPMSENLPADFPPRTLTAMRALSVVDAADGEDQRRLISALDILYHEYWVKHTPTHRPEVLKALLSRVLGTEEAEKALVQAAGDGKKLLAENTEKAFADGAFGLPWMVCTDASGRTEGFWGVDHLGQVVQFLGLSTQNREWKAIL